MSGGAVGDAEQLRSGIAALEAQRALLGDTVVDLALAPLRERLAAMQAQQTPAPEAQLLRQVSILFLDVVGSTRLGSELDPEDLHQLLDGAMQRFTAEVQRGGGRVLQYAGDSLLAVWGADGVREDDAERAVACGLALLQAGDERLQLRVGVHTGPVLLGGGVNAEGSIRGVAVHVAARMEQAAPVGGLRISHDTWLLVRERFEALPQPPLQVKGLDEPMRTHLVRRARPRDASAPGRETAAPLVGRQPELARLLQALDDAAATGRAQAVTVLAEAGLGKSRLLAALRQALQDRAHAGPVLLARAQPSSEARPYGLLRELLASRLQFGEDEPAAQVRTRLLEQLSPLFDDEPDPQRPALLLGRLIGLPLADEPALAALKGDARALRDQAFAAGVRLLARLSRSSGAAAVVLLDDLHWADEGSLDFLAHLLAHAPPGPVLLVMLARPALLERRPAWGEPASAAASASAGGVPQQLLQLQPLSEPESHTLARALLHGLPELPQVLAALLTQRAQGNPYYLEELVRMLLDDGVVHAVAGAPWQVQADRLHQLRLPPSLNGVLQARLDALAAPERQALQHAAVIGPVFWDSALQALGPGAPALLPALQLKGLVHATEASTFEGAREYRFHHALMHQAVYATVLKAPRRSAHARVAEWLRERMEGRGDEMLPVVAEHTAQAGDHAQASALFVQASERAQARYANATALEQAERALECATEPATRWRVLRLLAQLSDQMGDRERQARWCDALDALAEAADNNQWRAAVMIDRSLLADRLGEHHTALARSLALAEFAERHGLAHEAAMGLANCAWQHLSAENYASAREYNNRALVWARRKQGRLTLAQLLLVSASIGQVEGRWAEVQALLQEVQTLAQAMGPSLSAPRLRALLHERWHLLYSGLGDAPQALQHAQAGLHMVQQLGLRHHLETSLIHMTAALLRNGDLAAALATSQQTMDMAATLPEQHHAWPSVVSGHAQVLSAHGRHEEAEQHLRRVVAARRRDGPAWALREDLGELIDNLLAQGRAQAALPLVEELLLDPAPLFLRRKGAAVLWPCHRVLRALGDPRAAALAARATQAAHEELARVGDEALAQRTLAASPVLREALAFRG